MLGKRETHYSSMKYNSNSLEKVTSKTELGLTLTDRLEVANEVYRLLVMLSLFNVQKGKQ